VVGAGNAGANINAGVASLRGYLADEMPGRHRLWWAAAPAGPLAAVLAVYSPGNTAVLLFSTTATGRIAPSALADLLGGLAAAILDEGQTLVQALLDTHAAEDAAAFERAGFFRLAELIFMRNNLRGGLRRREHAEAPPAGMELLSYSDATDALFRRGIEASYAGSLDCPALEGLRHIEDVLAGHKAAGIFRADLWTVAAIDGEPAGVLLMNQNAMHNTAEVVYMGVSQPFRGRGLGRLLLRRAAAMAAEDRFAALTLAVDAQNHYAHRLYLDEGFAETMRKWAYVRLSHNH